MTTIKQPLTNAQLELLKVFTHNLTDEDLKELKKVLADFFANRLVEKANKVWDEKGWTEEDVQRMLNTKMRKTKNK